MKLSFSWEAATRLTLSLLLVLAPFFFLPWGTYAVAGNKQFFVVAVILISFFCYLGTLLVSGKFSYRSGGTLMLGFVGSLLVSFLLSGSYALSFFGVSGGETDSVLNLLSFALIFFIISSFFDLADIKKIVPAYLTILGILVIFELLLFFKFFSPFFAPEFNPIGTPLGLGVFFGGNLVFVVSLLLGAELDNTKKYLLSALGALMVAYLLVTQYSIVWLFLAISFAVMLLLLVYTEGIARAGEKKNNFNFLIAALTISLFLSFSNIPITAPLEGRIASLPPEVSILLAQNSSIAYESYRAGTSSLSTINSVLFGSGPATFVYEYLKYRPVELNNENRFNLWRVRFTEGYSTLGTYFVTLGAAGAVLFLLSFLFPVYRLLKTLLPKKKDPVSIALLPFLCYGILVCIFYTISYALLFILFVSLALLTIGINEKKEISLFKSPQGTVVVALFLILLMAGSLYGLYAESERFAGSRYYGSAAKSLRAGNTDEAIQKMSSAVTLDPRNDAYLRGLSEIFLAKLNSATASESDLANAITLANQAVSVNTAEGLNYISLARAYETALSVLSQIETLPEDQKNSLENSYLFALEGYRKAVERDPKNPELPFAVGKIHVIRGNYIEAEQSFRETLALKADYAPAHYLLGVTYDKMKKKNESLQEFKEALALDPENENIKKIIQNLIAGKPAF